VAHALQAARLFSVSVSAEKEHIHMSTNASRFEGLRLSKQRIVLLATVAGLGALTLGEFGLASKSGNILLSAAYVQTLQGSASFADIVDKVKPTVISVKVQMNPGNNTPRFNRDNPLRGTPFEDFFRRRFSEGGQRFGRPDSDDSPRQQPRQYVSGQGSGFFISADGYAVTNNHVVDKAERVEVTTDDGRTYTARVVGSDSLVDLALIKVDGHNDFPSAHFADRSPRVGDWVMAVGNPFGLGGTVTAGIVSARGRNIGAGPYDDFIQIDAAVNPGNSGGPSFDLNGNVIGVNTAIYSPSGGNVGIAFAIPADTVKTVVAQLSGGGSVARGWIGVQIQPLTAEIADSLGMRNARGALVAHVQPGSPAQRARIKAGDIIVSVNGESLDDARSLALRIGSMAPGTSVRLAVIRNGKEETLPLMVGELPSEHQANRN
jgi:serine protease Do